MNKKTIYPPKGFIDQIVKALLEGGVVTIDGLGNLYTSSVVKRHPSRVKNGYEVRKRKITTIRFRPEKGLKEAI